MTKITLFLVVLAAGFTITACQSEGSGHPEASEGGETEGSTIPTPSDPPASPEATGEGETSTVEFEPAYPVEVSREGLSEEDVAQQATQHSHDGGEAHSHDDGIVHGAGGSDDDPNH